MNEVILLVLENKLGITNQIALAKAEERISKQKAKHLYDSGKINEIEVGTFKGLATIHFYLFSDIYNFAGEIRTVNLAKENFRFAPLMYLETSLQYILIKCLKARTKKLLRNMLK